MNDCELHELMMDCPRLYHMAERGAWRSIRTNGLLSTSALLDLYGVHGERRFELESQRREDIVPLHANGLPVAKLRDQLAMDDSGLSRCLMGGINARDWYETINRKVFFWLTEARLYKFSNARPYKDGEREVLVLDTRSLIAAHRKDVWLCPMNSGATKPRAYPRGPDTFSRIEDYPYNKWRRKRGAGKRVVELCVDDRVEDVGQFVQRVYVVKGEREVRELAL